MKLGAPLPLHDVSGYKAQKKKKEKKFSLQLPRYTAILDSVINEALRLQPSIPSGTERLTPPSGITLYTNDGSHVFIPGNTTVRIPNYTLLRDARYFVHPESFIPERWTTRKELVIDASGFIPFGVGPYSCAGKQLGMMKTRATIAGLVMKFRWRLDAATDPEEFERAGKDEFSIAMGQCWVRFKKI
jgi:cytochrome P450 family 628